MVLAATGSPGSMLPTLVIALAADADERARIVRNLDDTPTLLVSCPEDALAFLTGAVEETADTAGPSGIAEPSSEVETELHIDSDARLAHWHENRVALSPLEHDLLLSLCKHLGHVRTFEWLQQHVWGNDHPGNRAHMQSLVKRLRRKLRQLGTPLEIDAVRGVGLRIVRGRPTGRPTP